MISDPSTKDLIAAARKATQTAPPNPMYHYVLALADRLEEVEESIQPVTCCDDPHVATVCVKCRTYSAHPSRSTPRVASRPKDSPEPSDPEPDRNEETEPSGSDSNDADPEMEAWANTARLARKSWTEENPYGDDPEPEGMRGFTPKEVKAAREMKEQFFFGEEPEDDPWEEVEAAVEQERNLTFRAALRALLDLRERVEQTKHIGRLHLDTLRALTRRLITLEGHAERGSEAEAELRGRVEKLEER